MSFMKVKINNLNLMSFRNKPFMLRTINLIKSKFLIRWLSWFIWMLHNISTKLLTIIPKYWMLIRTTGSKWCSKTQSFKSFTPISTSNSQSSSKKKSIKTKTISTCSCFTRVQRKETFVICILPNECSSLKKWTERRKWLTTRLIKLIKSTVTKEKRKSW